MPLGDQEFKIKVSPLADNDVRLALLTSKAIVGYRYIDLGVSWTWIVLMVQSSTPIKIISSEKEYLPLVLLAE